MVYSKVVVAREVGSVWVGLGFFVVVVDDGEDDGDDADEGNVTEISFRWLVGLRLGNRWLSKRFLGFCD